MRQVIDVIADKNLLSTVSPQAYESIVAKYSKPVNATLQRVKFETSEVPLEKIDIAEILERGYQSIYKDSPDDTTISDMGSGMCIAVSKNVFCVLKTLSLNCSSRNADYAELMTNVFAQTFVQATQGCKGFELQKLWNETTVEKEYVQSMVIKWVYGKLNKKENMIIE